MMEVPCSHKSSYLEANGLPAKPTNFHGFKEDPGLQVLVWEVCEAFIVYVSRNLKRDTKQTKKNETNENPKLFRLFRYFSFVSCLSPSWNRIPQPAQRV